MIITTTHHIEGREVTSYEGIVTGEAIIGAHVFKDFFAALRDFFGGRSGAYEKTIREAKDMALRDMEEKAKDMGADAILAVDIDYQSMGKTNSMLVAIATGTAVKLK